jgi:hypothetical protein
MRYHLQEVEAEVHANPVQVPSAQDILPPALKGALDRQGPFTAEVENILRHLLRD